MALDEETATLALEKAIEPLDVDNAKLLDPTWPLTELLATVTEPEPLAPAVSSANLDELMTMDDLADPLTVCTEY